MMADLEIKNHPFYGNVNCLVHVEPSVVDSYISRAYSEKLDRYLTDDEMNELQDDYSAEVQEVSWLNGSVNHN